MFSPHFRPPSRAFMRATIEQQHGRIQMANETFAQGHCLCGAVSYTISAKPIRMARCHCKDCQRASGTGHMSLAFFKKEDVAIRGTTASFASTADSGNANTRHFCPVCGSRVYGENSARPGIVGITVGCLDENDWFAPQAVVYTGRRARGGAVAPPPAAPQQPVVLILEDLLAGRPPITA